MDGRNAIRPTLRLPHPHPALRATFSQWEKEWDRAWVLQAVVKHSPPLWEGLQSRCIDGAGPQALTGWPKRHPSDTAAAVPSSGAARHLLPKRGPWSRGEKEPAYFSQPTSFSDCPGFSA
ncbi:hypothetical protein GGR64_000462 [Xanthomonas arboricola]|nr:hypothetical protein [Xanthomonas sp. 3307]